MTGKRFHVRPAVLVLGVGLHIRQSLAAQEQLVKRNDGAAPIRCGIAERGQRYFKRGIDRRFPVDGNRQRLRRDFQARPNIADRDFIHLHTQTQRPFGCGRCIAKVVRQPGQVERGLDRTRRQPKDRRLINRTVAAPVGGHITFADRHLQFSFPAEHALDFLRRSPTVRQPADGDVACGQGDAANARPSAEIKRAFSRYPSAGEFRRQLPRGEHTVLELQLALRLPKVQSHRRDFQDR